MEKFKNLHIWMIIPMIIMQLGIFMDYWMDFSENAWPVHIHYWTGTLWYVYLIIQPYYATHGQMDKHRTNGIIGMFLAGGVSITAFAMLDRDINTIQRSIENAERFGPFVPSFFYGVIIVEIVMMLAFIFAIIQSIKLRKSLEDHAWWLCSTVFLIMMPALGRGIQNISIMMQSDKWPNVDIYSSIYLCQFIIIALLLLTAYKFKKLKHPATYLAVAVNVFVLFKKPMGESEILQTIIDALIISTS